MVLSHHLRLLLILYLSFLPLTFSDLAANRAALLRLRAAVRGRILRWNTTHATPCSWDGVTCDNVTNNVVALRLPRDGLTGQLPLNTIGNLTGLKALSLRGNSLSGPIPADIASCTLLQDLHLEGNNFSGEIPSSFFTLRNLLRVNLAGNDFSGALSPGFNELTQLRTLYLENNQFTGPLPDLSNLTDLRQFNVSFNGLTGSIPSRLNTFSSESFLGTSLCGGPLVPCPSNDGDHDNGGNNKLSRGNNLSGGAIAGIAVGSFIVLIIILVVIFISWRKMYKTEKIPPQTKRSPVKPSEHKSSNVPQAINVVIEGDNRSKNSFSGEVHGKDRLMVKAVKNSRNYGLVFLGDDVGELSLRELLSLSAKVMGKGTTGSTYKAYLDNGVEIIVKRLKNVCVSEKEFKGKIEELGSLVHENLDPIKGYFCGREEKLVIYNALPKGSLHELLHGKKKQQLSWEMRAKIALGAARGINYLHSISPNNTHGNIKSSNILVTDDHEARVSEYGLTQLVSNMSTPNTYRAPESTNSRNISQQADVYSFGVLLLELLTVKAPDNEEGIQLPDWVQSVVQEKWTIQVFDSDLLRYEMNLEENMVQLLHLAISCTALQPHRRPSMLQIMRSIEEICGERN